MMLRAHRFWPLLAASILLPLHLKLDKSSPSAGAVLTAAPTKVQLWFSQPVELPVTKVTIASDADTQLATGALLKAEDGAVVAPISTAVTAGSYKVSWRTMAKDGHVIKGEFSFVVK